MASEDIDKTLLRCKRFLGEIKCISKGYYLDQLSDSDNITFRGGSFKDKYVYETYKITSQEYDAICINGKLNLDHSKLYCRRYPREIKMINNLRYVDQISENENRSFSAYEKEIYLKVNYNLTMEQYIDIIMFDKLSDVKYNKCNNIDCNNHVKLDYKEQKIKYCSKSCMSKVRINLVNYKIWHTPEYENFRQEKSIQASRSITEFNKLSWQDPNYRSKVSERSSKVMKKVQQDLMKENPEKYSKQRIHNSLKLSYLTELNRVPKDAHRLFYIGDITNDTFKIGITSDLNDRCNRLGLDIKVLKEGTNLEMATLEYLIKYLFEDLDFNYHNSTTEVFKSSRKDSILEFIKNYNYSEWESRLSNFIGG